MPDEPITHLFLDCEWADVLASELVSIALVSLDGEHLFYAERERLPVDSTPWVAAVVYPLLQRGRYVMTDEGMSLALRTFLASVERPQICYDFGADRMLCQYVIDGFEVPEPLGPAPVDLTWRLLTDTSSAVEQWWKAHPDARGQRHHALADAQALRGAWRSLNETTPRIGS